MVGILGQVVGAGTDEGEWVWEGGRIQEQVGGSAYLAQLFRDAHGSVPTAAPRNSPITPIGHNHS